MVLDVAVAVRVPRLGEVTVMVWPLTPTTPTKSSMRSSLPEPRVELARGSETKLRMGVVASKVTAMLPPETVTALERLKLRSRPAPVEPTVMGEASVMVGLLATARLAVQTVFAGQAAFALVMAAPVLLA